MRLTTLTVLAMIVAGASLGDAQSPPANQGRGADANLLKRLPTEQQWNASAETKAYVAKALELAGDDGDLKFDVGVFCKPSGGSLTTDRETLGVPDSEPRLTPFPTKYPPAPVPPQRLFDNFYWFGNSSVGAWLATTDEGYILFDAMSSDADARDVIEAGMKTFGLDPAKIRYVVFGHFHIDHTGGGAYFQRTYGARAVMSRDDWDDYFKTIKAGTGQAAQIKNQRPLTREVEAHDGMTITVGDVTATIYQMTGHTVGSIGMVIPVKYQRGVHPILIVTAGTDAPNRHSFVGGYEHIWNQGITHKVESVMQAHPNTNINSLARMKYVTDNYPPARNPLLYGADKTRRYLEILRACTQARIAALGW
jgi:metallo-beta-lactamase class B